MVELSIFFCISYYEGDIEWLRPYLKDNFVVYWKSNDIPPVWLNNKIVKTDNVGYNLHSYFTFIIDNYETLPEVVVFCKNNLVDRHMSIDVFSELIKRTTFTPLVDDNYFDKLSFPVSFMDNNSVYHEFNDDWYSNKYPGKYFFKYNDFYNWAFKDKNRPIYLSFAPGGNYIVRRENILSRPREFYINLRNIISHSQLSLESHFVERSLSAIWNSNIKHSCVLESVQDISLLKINAKLRNHANNPEPLARLKNKAFLLIVRALYRLFI